jgi:hypothetical protein
MQKKILTQIFLIIIIFIILLFFYNLYFVDKKIKLNNIITDNIATNLDIKNSNILYDVEYFAEDDNGGKYKIKAKIGEIKNNQPDLIFLKDVSAIITFKNSSSINILSNDATYSSTSYNTNFYGNVMATYTDNIILSNNLDLDFGKNLAFIYDNVIFKNLNTKLLADKIEIDLISKNSKIFMDNKLKKVKVINKK